MILAPVRSFELAPTWSELASRVVSLTQHPEGRDTRHAQQDRDEKQRLPPPRCPPHNNDLRAGKNTSPPTPLPLRTTCEQLGRHTRNHICRNTLQ